MPTPRQILESLLPVLKIAAAYANQLQSRINKLPAKESGNNFFAAALTDADLAVQNLVEVTLLGILPELRFYGEEYERSNNTKYFRAAELGEQGDYLVTLDPIDGTQFYIDGHSNYQIILSVLNRDDFEAVLAISPAQQRYYYGLRGEGTFWGTLEAGLEACTPLKIGDPKPAIFLGWDIGELEPTLREQYQVVNVATAYSRQVQIPNFNGILSGELTGAVLASANFIDAGALAFLAREAGCIATALDGSRLPPLHTCSGYSFPGLMVASSRSVHQDLLEALQNQS